MTSLRRRTLRAGQPARLQGMALALAACGCMSMAHGAEDFAGFKMTSYEGHVSLGGLRDDFMTLQPAYGDFGPSLKTQLRTNLRGEFNVMTHSYVYHPKFLSLDLGGGPVYESASLDSNDQRTRSNKALYNLYARASLLSDKPYRGTVYYEHLNPMLSVGPAEVLNQQTEKFGFTMALLAPTTPIPLALEASRTHTNGSSEVRVIDDRIDRFTFKADRAWGGNGRTRLGFDLMQQASSSGVVDLPIQGSQQHTRTLNADTELRFGKDKQYEFFNTLRASTQEYELEQGHLPRVQDLRAVLTYRGLHGRDWQSSASYNASRSRQDEQQNTVQSLNLGALWRPTDRLSFNAGLRGERTEASNFKARLWGGDGSMNFAQPLPLGTFYMSYSARYDEREQSASAPLTNVIGEAIALPGVQPVGLAQTKVTPGSVLVSNPTRTQVYVEGIDYALSVVGQTTRIQRLLGGNILDAADVLVDYSFDVGGSYASSQWDQNLSLNWAFKQYVNAYVRYQDTTPKVLSGTPTAPLNTIQSTLYGLRAEVPLNLPVPLLLGGFAERETRRETIAPFVRTASELFVQGDLPFIAGANYRLAARRSRIDADNAYQASHLKGVDVALGWMHSSGVRIFATSLVERDTAAIEYRERRAMSLRAVWRFRRISLTADLTKSREVQGQVERERTVGNISLRRDFSS